MRLVRCDACGSKAILAASQCPKCAQPLYVRNTRGDEVPLTRCRGCDTYYPQSRDGCRWCTAEPRRTRVPRWAATAAGILVMAGAALSAARFLPASNPAPAPNVATPPPSPRQVAVREPAIKRLPPVTAVPALAVAATLPPASSRPAIVANDNASSGDPAVTVKDDTGSARPAVTANHDTSSGRMGTMNQGTDSGRTSDKSGRAFARATTWVNVRAEPSSESSVVGIVRPDSIVTIGDSRRGWRRVTTSRFSGWAAGKLFVVDSTLRPGS